jgi:RsiW-degrading membrane proteinase PrsW (M82 family)
MKPTLFRHLWFLILTGGIVFFALTEIVLITTGNPLFFPTVILLGAFIVPVTFIAYFYEYVRDRDIPQSILTACFIVGGIVGVILAGLIEFRTLRSLGIVSLFGIGLIEESVKLVFPIIMFVMWKYRHEADGLLFGVSAGMGFAALETMGYAMIELVRSGGSIGTLQQVLLIRGLLSPSGHAAWTGLVCAVLWRQRQKTGKWFGLPVLGAFVLAIVLHAVWDIVNTMNVQNSTQLAVSIVLQVAIIIISLGLIIWRFRRARAYALRESKTSAASS